MFYKKKYKKFKDKIIEKNEKLILKLYNRGWFESWDSRKFSKKIN